MDYCILTAKVETKRTITSSLFSPVEYNTVYSEDPVFTTFDNEHDAKMFAVQYWPYKKWIVLPGHHDALCFHASMWMGKGEKCLDNQEHLQERLTMVTDWNWDFYDKDWDSMNKAMLEVQECEEDKPRSKPDNGKKYQVGSYLSDDSKFVLFKTSSVFIMFHKLSDIEFDDLPIHEQELVITSDSINKKRVTVSMGALFDLALLKKFNGNKVLATIYATSHALYKSLGMKRYRITNKIEQMWHENVYKFNLYRDRKGWL